MKKKLKTFGIITFIIVCIIFISKVYKTNNLAHDEPSYLTENKYTFEEIEVLNSLPENQLIMPSIMGFANGNYYFENNELSSKMSFLSKNLFRYNFARNEVVSIMDVKPNIKIIGATHLKDKLTFCYIDMNDWASDKPFNYTVSAMVNGQEQILLQSKFWNDTLYPHFKLIDDKLYFLLPNLKQNQNSEDINYDVTMTLYSYDSENISNIYESTSSVIDSRLDSKKSFILDTNLHLNNKNELIFQEVSDTHSTINILKKNKIQSIDIEPKYSLIETVNNKALLYDLNSQNYIFFDLITKEISEIEEQGRIYEPINIADKYICVLKEDGKHYIISPDNSSFIEFKTPISNLEKQREFIFTDGNNVILQISDLNNNSAQFYELILL